MSNGQEQQDFENTRVSVQDIEQNSNTQSNIRETSEGNYPIRMKDIEDSFDVPIPKDPLRRIIGQDFAIKIARMAAQQKRNLLL
ncbi:MAG: hypothetical protein FK734_01060, partial [Asgard group archaeon]|nr:hypothetical protein [Asgard group archaeon]